MIATKTDSEAIEILMNGGVGVMAADTVYGIMARASDPEAVARFYALKQRDHKPGTVIAANVQQLIDLGVPAEHMEKVAHWWPNPLSVETPLGANLTYLHQDTGRQAFRVVADERLQKLLAITGPLVTSSANQPGKPGSVTVQEAYDYFADAVDFYVDGGNLAGRTPSTIIKITDEGSIEIIRQGAFTFPHPNCPFCRGNNKLRGEIIAESETAYVLEHQPQTRNYLIIPTVHYEQLTDLPDSWWCDIKTMLKNIPSMPDSYNLSVNIGADAGQSVKHLHFWIIERSPEMPHAGKGLARILSET